MKMKSIGMSVVLCCLLSFFSAGCEGVQEEINALNMAGPGQPYSWLTDEEKAAEARKPSINVDLDDSYWRTQHSIDELERIRREAARDTARINAASRRMLYEMELQKKLKELERQQRELKKQR